MWGRDAIRAIACLLAIFSCVSLAFGQDVDRRKKTVVENGIGLSIFDYSEGPNSEVIPILYFHGTSSSKSEPELLEGQIKAKKRLLISFDRPGYGHSQFHYFESLDDFDQWTREKLMPAVHKTLGFKPQSFDLVSVSGGAQYSLRMAQSMPDQVRKLSLFSAGLFARPVGKEGRFEDVRRLANKRPVFVERIAKSARRHPELTHLVSTIALSPPDRQFANCHRELSKKLFAEATRCGASGIRQDARLQLCDTSYAKPISPKIQCGIWNGTCDYTISLDSAKLLSERTEIKLYVIQGEGHLSSLPISFDRAFVTHPPRSPKVD